MSETVLAVDGNNILMRAVRAMEGKELSADGVATGALVVFINTMARYVIETRPDRVVVCFDAGHVYRSNLFPGYKSGRAGGGYRYEVEGDPFNLAKQFLTLAGVHHVMMNGVEADDIIAHYWRTRDPDDHLIILSGDKDLLQLLGPGVTQIRPGDKVNETWTAERVEKEFGYLPEHAPFVMALIGDQSDSIPGVGGVGPVTAIKWLSENHWQMCDVLHNVERMHDKRDIALRNLAIVNLRDNAVGLSFVLPPRFHPTTPDSLLGQELLSFFDQYELTRARTRWLDDALWKSAGVRPPGLESQGKMF